MSVEVESLTVRYGDLVAVDAVSFVAPSGEVTAILGPNGAGKTSTIEVCEGFRRATAGNVRVCGLDPGFDHAALTRRMGVMLQGGGVYPSARVADVVAHFCALHDKGVDPAALVDRLGLRPRASSTWRRLSGGEQQRVSLALALAADPEVVFLDEPTSGVDIDGRDVIAQIIGELAAGGSTVVLATHEMAEAERVASRAVFFRDGHVVAQGRVSELRRARGTLRFTTDSSLDRSSLARDLGCDVAALGGNRFEAATAPTPDAVARLGRWLADAGVGLGSIDMGIESLEDVYRSVTGGGT